MDLALFGSNKRIQNRYKTSWQISKLMLYQTQFRKIKKILYFLPVGDNAVSG